MGGQDFAPHTRAVWMRGSSGSQTCTLTALAHDHDITLKMLWPDLFTCLAACTTQHAQDPCLALSWQTRAKAALGFSKGRIMRVDVYESISCQKPVVIADNGAV